MPIIETSEYEYVAAYVNQRKVVRSSVGTLYAVYSRESAGVQQVYIKHSLDDGNSWIDETRISLGDGMALYDQTGPCIAIGSNDYLYVIWVGKATGFDTEKQVWYTRYNGVIWEIPTRISDGPPEMEVRDQYLFNSICVGPNPILGPGNDVIHVAWAGEALGYAAGDYQIWYRFYDPFEDIWSDAERVSTRIGMDEYPQYAPVVVVNSGGLVHVFWFGGDDTYGSHLQVWISTAGTFEPWGGPNRVSNEPGMDLWSQGSVSAAVGPDDVVHLVWSGQATGYGEPQIWYTSGHDIERVSADGPEAGVLPTIGVDVNGTVFVIWATGVPTGVT